MSSPGIEGVPHNLGINRSAKQRRCCLVPVALRAPAPGYAGRYAAFDCAAFHAMPSANIWQSASSHQE
jgi:hypothetical protein